MTEDRVGRWSFVANADRVFLASIAALAALYLLQIVTPLRLDTDSVHYFLTAIGLADHTPAHAAAYPLGYPTILAILDRTGHGSPHWIVAVNCVFLGLGMAAVWWMARDRAISIRRWTLALTLLSVPVVRSIAMPHPEAVYFGLTLMAIAAMSGLTTALTGRNLWMLGVAVALSAAAVTLKLAAFSLVPPLLWSALRVTTSVKGSRSNRIALSAVVLCAILVLVGLAVAVSDNGTLLRYFVESAEKSTGPVTVHAGKRLVATLRALGELTINLPLRHFMWLNPWLPVLGVATAALFLLAFTRMRWRSTTLIYLVTYVMVLVVWPYYTSRHWMPIVPLLVLHTVTAVHSIPKGMAARIALRSYVFWFIATGAAALAFTTRISLAGENFRSRYGTNGGMAARDHKDSVHDAYARMIIGRFDAGNPAWLSLGAPPRHETTENVP
jgi:hypothetical protein